MLDRLPEMPRRRFTQVLIGGFLGLLLPTFAAPVRAQEELPQDDQVMPELPSPPFIPPSYIDFACYMAHLNSPQIIDRIVATNLNAGRQAVTVSEIIEMFSGEKEVPNVPLFGITLDDGYLSQYTQLAPVLDRRGVPGTFYVMGTGWQGDGVHQYMKTAQIKDLSERGHDIGSHTVNHASLVALRARNFGAYLGEIYSSKAQLEDLIQEEITSIAYPNGSFDQAVIAEATKAGYKGGLTEVVRTRQNIERQMEMGRLRAA